MGLFRVSPGWPEASVLPAGASPGAAQKSLLSRDDPLAGNGVKYANELVVSARGL